MSRFSLRVKAAVFCTLAYFVDRYLSTPRPLRYPFTRTIPCSLSTHPGSIKPLFYTPKSYKTRPSIESPSPTSSKPWKGYPILIDFHGRGFSIGKASDDARWATAVAEHNNFSKDAVVITVDYRLTPKHPFPTGIEDCASAIPWTWDHGPSLGLDAASTALSGVSAGANLSLTMPMHLHAVLASHQADSRTPPEGKTRQHGSLLS
jgi:acetyl esterase/lipase